MGILDRPETNLISGHRALKTPFQQAAQKSRAPFARVNDAALDELRSLHAILIVPPRRHESQDEASNRGIARAIDLRA